MSVDEQNQTLAVSPPIAQDPPHGHAEPGRFERTGMSLVPSTVRDDRAESMLGEAEVALNTCPGSLCLVVRVRDASVDPCVSASNISKRPERAGGGR